MWTKYGAPDGLQLQEVAKPAPNDDEVLIRIHAASVTAGDIEVRSLKLSMWLALPMRLYVGLLRPRRITILGQEHSGEIEAVGRSVTRFTEGDQVFAATGFGLGGYAEYICMPENPEDGVLAEKSVNLTYEEADTAPFGGLEALHFLGKGNLQRGEEIAVNGAGGTIGTYGVQLATHFGARATAVDSGDKLEMLRSIGAAQVIDYTQEDFTMRGETYDVVFDVIGKSSFSGSIRVLKENGRYLTANPRLSHMVRGPLVSARSSKKVIYQPAARTTEDLLFLKGLIEGGDLKPVIDRSYPLEQAAEAHRYAESGRKKGNVVLRIDGDRIG